MPRGASTARNDKVSAARLSIMWSIAPILNICYNLRLTSTNTLEYKHCQEKHKG
ncbi:hypothetical protein [Helicobacter canis]|uniref:hypothetical protein n=1 Tax=Helicobacter canis TaxID=29419 RepID=UPI0015F0C071|nr:hypothetical protein [Helicobacter canis]